MKICLVSREYPPETMWGGIGTFTYNLAHGLKNIGHEVDVLAFTSGIDGLRQSDEGITIHRISSPRIPFTKKTWWEFSRYALSPFAYLYSYKIMQTLDVLNRENHFDVIDFPEHIGEGYFSALFRKWPCFIRLYTPLSLIGELGLRRATNRLDYFLIKVAEKSSIKNAILVNSPSRNLASLVQTKFKFKKEVSIVYNPIDTEKFSPTTEKHSHSGERIKVLFAGRLEDRKGAHILARAIPEIIKANAEVDFIFLGRDCCGIDGYASMKQYIINILDNHGLRNHVTFIDPVPYDQLVTQYRSVDILAVPSLYDNSPYTCLEAMSCGIPVVGTSAGGMPEYIDDGQNGLIVPPDNPQQLAAALISLVQNSPKRMRFGAAARHKVLSVFKREVVATEMVTLYQRGLATMPSRLNR